MPNCKFNIPLKIHRINSEECHIIVIVQYGKEWSTTKKIRIQTQITQAWYENDWPPSGPQDQSLKGRNDNI